MRITEIRIEGLFDMFDHVIPLNQEEHLTVIYGINGIGKTMIFRILDCFYNGNFEELVKFPFEKLVLVFENDDVLELSYVGQIQPLYNGKIVGRVIGNGETYEQTVLKLIGKTPTHFINTERLSHNEGFKEMDGKKTFFTSKKIKYYSSLIKRQILELYNDYLKLSEQLELSVSKRLLNNKIRKDFTFEGLADMKYEIETRIKELQDIGLMETKNNLNFELNENIDEIDKALIAANLSDFQIKLAVFDDFYNRLTLFLDILNNRRLSYKTIAVSMKNGFEITNIKNQKIELTQLSTGEQHAIIMFYSLLFEVTENALVMIDEPENSLHIIWQKEFLNDMKDIIALRGFDVLIATYSPSIINGEWDLTVSLKGVEEEEYA